MTKICNKIEICHNIYLICFTELSYFMIIMGLLEILRHPDTCLKTKLNMAAAYILLRNRQANPEGTYLQGQKKSIGLYG